MSSYKKHLYSSYLIVISFALILTFLCKLIFNPLLFQQQELLSQQLSLSKIPMMTSAEGFSHLVEQQLFDYISINNSELSTPLTYKSENFNHFFTYILSIPTSTVISENGEQTVTFHAKNNQLIKLLTQTLLTIYCALILSCSLINYIYYRMLRNLEKKLIQEISNEETTPSSLPKISKLLLKKKNIIINKIKSQDELISQLQKQANMDNLTGLNNRNAFRNELTEILSRVDEQKHAIIAIIRASELNSINSRHGFQQGDEYIISLSKLIQKAINRFIDINIYRISGSDFAFIAPNMSISDSQRVATDLKSKFDQFQALNKLESIAYIGISSIISGQLPEQVLARTDLALAKAQTEGVNSWVFEHQGNDGKQFGQQHWRDIIGTIIDKQSLILLQQPILATHRNMKGYQQIFTRFIGENNTVIPTESILAMAQRIDMTVKLEQFVLQKLVKEFRGKVDSKNRWAINITSSALQNSSFIVWLERLLLREPNIAASLTFEIQEDILDSNIVSSRRVFDMLKRTGTRSSICNFGKGIGSFHLFKALKPDFVKIDASLINNIERDSANQQFVRMIIDVAHRMDCRVIAEGVEHLEQKQILENMYIDGIQGFLIARPVPV